jgi:hypothetical protein
MSAATAIGKVGESLQRLLDRHLGVDPPAIATLLAPDEPGPARRVNLFLFEVGENPYLRNAEPQVRPGTTTLVPPPLSLTLSYLLTAYAPTDEQSGDSAAHQLLGAAMRVLHDHPVLPADVLVGDLGRAREQVRILHVPRTVAEATQLWGAIDQPYRISAFYEVSVVQIDSSAPDGALAKRVHSLAVGEPQSSYRPPLVSAMVVAEHELRFDGEHLRGRRATVTMTGRTLLQHDALEDDDSFRATLPAGLDPGLHEVRVDVDGDFRRTFLCEVP